MLRISMAGYPARSPEKIDVIKQNMRKISPDERFARVGARLLVLAVATTLFALGLHAQEFRTTAMRITNGIPTLDFQSVTSAYYQVWTSTSLTTGIWTPQGMTWGCDGAQVWTRGSSDGERQLFFRVHQIPLGQAHDEDGDDVDDVTEMMWGCNPLSQDSDGDGYPDRADPKPADPGVPDTNLIAAVSGGERAEPMHYAVFTVNADGTDRQQLTATRFMENHVVYTPTATALVCQTYREDTNGDGEFDEDDIAGSAIMMMNGDGTRPRVLADVPGAIDAVPDISPDGQHIIFASDRHDPGARTLRLYVMDIDGANVTQVGYASNAPSAAEIDSDPCWGVSNRICFIRMEPASATPFSRIYTAEIDPVTFTLSDVTMRTDTTNVPVTIYPPGDYDPKISPDGQKIASYRHIDDSIIVGSIVIGRWDLWVGDYVAPDKSVTFLDPDPERADAFPRWNSTGDRLAFWSITTNFAAGGAGIDVCLINADGASRTNLTSGLGWFEQMPSWHPQEDRLIYSAHR